MSQIPGIGCEGGSPRPGLMQYIGSSSMNSTSDTYSWATQTPANTAPAGRLYFILQGATGGQKTATGVTVGGVAATKVPYAETTATFTPSSIWYFDHPGGTIGAVVTTWSGSGSMRTASIHCFSFSDFDTAFEVFGARTGGTSGVNGDSLAAMAAHLAGDWRIAGYHRENTTIATCTWSSNMTETSDDANTGAPGRVRGTALQQASVDVAANVAWTTTYTDQLDDGGLIGLIVRGI